MNILIVVLVLLLVLGVGGTGPWHGYSANWGYGPSGIVGAVLLVLIVLALMGRL